ncbi:MAG TPA: peroxiredoxin [Rhodanobacteraceae bacterium]|nr:peroxiredoxin [Rhodanobacteraceae bacterium]
MAIKTGGRIPDSMVNMLNDGIEPISTQSFFAGRKVLLFAVPGAFTPTCSNLHLPGYVKHLDDFEQRGITVACMAVNDAFVMRAWADSQHVPRSLAMLADGNGAFTCALGMEMDGSGFGMGRRARRFALYAEDGVVRILHPEAPGEFRVSSAEAMLQALDSMKS